MGAISKLFQIFIGILVFVAIGFWVVSCGSDDQGGGKAVPEIVGCNSIDYRGMIWATGCAPGIVSFDQTTSQAGVTVSFHITCSGGCVSTVEVLSGTPHGIVLP